MSTDDATPTVQDAPPAVDDLSPSCKLVWLVLVQNGPGTQGDLAEWSGLPGRTVRYALDRLENANCIYGRPSTQDARCTLYCPRE